MKLHRMHEVVGDVFIPSRVYASSAPIELQKSITSNTILYGDM